MVGKGFHYFPLGGLVPIALERNKIQNWLDYCFSTIRDKVKVHGFGINSFYLMQRYPFYSVDATSWLTYGQKLAKVVIFDKGKMYSAGGMGRNGQFKGDIVKHPLLLTEFKDKENDLKYRDRDKRIVQEYIKAEEYLTRLWEKRGIKWE